MGQIRREININKYAPCITEPSIAKEIYQSIIESEPDKNEIHIQMDEVISLTCQCINIIFGDLYMKIGADNFHNNIFLDGCGQVLGDFISFIVRERIKNG